MLGERLLGGGMFRLRLEVCLAWKAKACLAARSLPAFSLATRTLNAATSFSLAAASGGVPAVTGGSASCAGAASVVGSPAASPVAEFWLSTGAKGGGMGPQNVCAVVLRRAPEPVRHNISGLPAPQRRAVCK